MKDTLEGINPLSQELRLELFNEMKKEPEIFGTIYPIGLESTSNPRLRKPQASQRGNNTAAYAKILGESYEF